MTATQPNISQLMQILQMEDPSNSAGSSMQRIQVNESCLDFLLAEMVEYVFKSTLKCEEDREAVAAKLEGLGYRVGVALAER